MAENKTSNQGFLSDFIKMQAELPKLSKDAKGIHDAKYLTLPKLLEEVLPVLHKHGFGLFQVPSTIDGQPSLKTVVFHERETHHRIESDMLLLLKSADPQGQGSALTYARRYALTAILGIAADEDDDGEKATKSKPIPRQALMTDAQRKRIFATISERGVYGSDNVRRIFHNLTGTEEGQSVSFQQAHAAIEDIKNMSDDELKDLGRP